MISSRCAPEVNGDYPKYRYNLFARKNTN